MKTARWLPLIAALLVSSAIVLAQQGTAFFGDVLVLYRQDAGAFPSATNYRGGIVYDTGSETPWFSNGTSWQPISSGGGGGGGFWFDAGAGTFAIYPSPTSNQVRAGTQDYPAYTGYTPIAGIFGTPDGGLSRPSMVVYTDGGMGMVIYVDRKARTLATNGNTQPGTNWYGAALSILTDRTANADDYAQIFLGARGQNATGAISHSAITHAALTAGTFGVVPGLTMSTGGNMGFVVGDNYNVAYPMFYLGSGQLASFGGVVPNANARVTVNAVSSNAAIDIVGVNPNTTAVRFTANNYGMDLGTGANDELFSDGTRVRVGNSTNGGGLNAFTFRVVGNTDGSNMVASATSGNGGIGFRQTDNQLYTMSSGKEARPLLSGADWTYDGRVWNIDVSWENTNCPVVQNTVISSSGANVTVSCTDVAAGGAAVSPSGFPVRGYRTFNTDTVAGSRSGFSSGTMPASGAGGTPTLFLQRRGGPVMAMWVRTGSTVSNARWYAGMLTAIPSVGLPSSGAQGAYLRFDTSASDTQFRLCTQDGTTVNCANSGTTPATNTEYLFLIDCRESSTACRLYVNGANAVANTANLPSLTVNMGFVFAIENTSTTAQSWGLGRTTIRTE